MARTRIRSVSEQKLDSAAAVAERRRQTERAEEKAVEDVQTARKPSVHKPERAGGGLLSRIPVVRSVVAYFQGVVSEMQKVTWPSREETSRLTSVVLGVTVVFSIGLGLLDAFYSWWFRQAFHPDTEWLFLAVAAVVAAALSGGYLALRRYI